MLISVNLNNNFMFNNIVSKIITNFAVSFSWY